MIDQNNDNVEGKNALKEVCIDCQRGETEVTSVCSAHAFISRRSLVTGARRSLATSAWADDTIAV